MTPSTTGITLARLVDQVGWQEALETLRTNNHPSHIWDWMPNLQRYEYTLAKNYLATK